jgi:hypothetical protein
VGDHVEIDLLPFRDLAPEVIERHQEIGSKHVGLVLYLSIFGIPANNILFTAAEAIRVRRSVQQEVAEFVSQREIDPALRTDPVVVDC